MQAQQQQQQRRVRNAMTLTVCIFMMLLQQTHGHGFMFDPPSRNYVAHVQGVNPKVGSEIGVPSVEYCPHCLNRSNGLCGLSEQHGQDGAFGDYDAWLDSTRQHVMPWMSQATYIEGDAVMIQSNLWVHHGGHMEVRACPMGRQSTKDCMEDHKLTFVEDVAYGMPADPNYPERGYYYGGAQWDGYDFAMSFKLPEDLVGTEVLLQWRYVTANSCTPIGYADYFASNPTIPSSFWNSELRLCPVDLPWDGSLANGAPEQFFNCAEVSITPKSSTVDGTDPTTTTSSTTSVITTNSAPTTTTTTASTAVDETGDINNRSGPNLIAFVGNWLECPSVEQYSQYTHVMISFAVSYRWQPGKNACSATCEIEMPPMCTGASANTFVKDLQDAGKKVLLSFGGAGMGGSWSSSVDDCWEHCFGREAQVVGRVAEIVHTLGLDGVDIDYEYFYEDNQRNSGFNKGKQAQHFITQLTTGLRDALPKNQGYLITHTPMDIDLLPGTAYFNILRDINDAIDFIMPQYYNGITRPILDGVTGFRPGYPSTGEHFMAIATQVFRGDTTKVLPGFCNGDCAGTGSNANGPQAAKVMEDLLGYLGGSCPGGAFFWVATDDVGGAWSTQVQAAMSSDDWKRNCAGLEVGVITSPPTISDDAAPATRGPTASPVSIEQPTPATPVNPQCRSCTGGSSGECQKPSDGHCWPYRHAATRECYTGTIDCGVQQAEPAASPTSSPTASPTSSPIASPTSSPTASPTSSPVDSTPITDRPTGAPTKQADGASGSVDEDLNCGLEWDHCNLPGKSCCTDYECIQYDSYTSMCRPIAGKCLPEGEACLGEQLACCNGLECQGDEWYKFCQEP